MSKKFISSEIFRKKWFRKCPANIKLFWFYLLAECNCAGVYEPDVEAAEFQLGIKLSQEEILQYLQFQLLPLSDGNWLIKDYMRYQYNKTYETLGDTPIDRNLRKYLDKYVDEIENPTLWGRVAGRVSYTLQEKEKEKEIIKVKRYNENKSNTISLIEQFDLIQDKFNSLELELKDEFLAYWTEKSIGGKKERWEMEKVFDVNRRFRTWIKNNGKFGKFQKPEKDNSITAILQCQEEEAKETK